MPDDKHIKKERVDEEINFGRIILFQMFDISRAMSVRSPLFADLVDTLDILMTPYHDPEYKKGKEAIDNEHQKNIKKVKDEQLTQQQGLKYDYMRSKKLFAELMKLISRKGLLPKKIVDWNE